MSDPSSGRSRRKRELHREHRRAQIGRAAVVGLVAGLAGVGFEIAVRDATDFAHFIAIKLPIWLLIPTTAFLGGMAAWGTGRFAPEAGGSGIPHTKAVLLHLKVLRPVRVIAVKVIAGILAFAAGMSLGREGPTVQIGAATGRLVGELFRVPKRSYGALIAAGSGAGLAAAFNAPLAGFLFVMEEMKREMSAVTYGTALIASVCSVAVTRYLLGQEPSFHIPGVTPPSLMALGPIALFGVIAGVGGVLFNKSLLLALEARERFQIPRWAAGALVGCLAGALLLYFPAVTGGGHRLVEALLTGHIAVSNLFAFALAVFALKVIFTALSYGTGVPGGIFAPQLVMGAFLGYAFGLATQHVMPGVAFPPAGFATIGMAGVLSGSVRAPLTGVVLIVEMTAEYQLLYALLIGAFAAYAVAELIQNEPIYEALLERDLSAGGASAPDDEEPETIEFMIEPDSELDGRRMRDLDMPEGALVIAVARHQRRLVPRGATELQAGDIITAVVDGENFIASHRLHEMARGPR